MTIALVSNVTGSGLNGGTSASINTTGANLLVIAVSYNTGTISVSDSKGNTWATASAEYRQASQNTRIYYVANPTVGTGHTFTVSGTGLAIAFIASAWSGAASSPVDVSGGVTSAGATASAAHSATLTPTENNCLVISGNGIGGSTTYSSGSGFTTISHVNFSSGANYGLGAVYQLQTTATGLTTGTSVASWSGSLQLATASAVFKAAAGALISGTASLDSISSSAIGVTGGAASGGTSPYSYQWHRSTTANFTPGVGTSISGATALSYSDTSASADTVYYYKLVSTDNASATVTSNQIAGVRLASALVIGCLGDSITKGTAGPAPASVTVPQRLQAQLQSMYQQRSVTVSNQGVDGASAQDFAANTGSIFSTAKTAFASAGCTHILIMLGANDAADHRTAAQFLADMQTIIGPGTGSLITAGYKVIVNYPTYIPAGANGGATDEAATEYMRSYLAQIDSLIDGVDVIRGDALAYKYFMDHQSETQTDRTHLLDAGNISLANMWARAFDRAILQVTNVVSPLAAQTVTITLVSSTGTAQTSLSSLKWAWWDQATPNLHLAPTCQGTAETTDGSGVLTIPITTSLVTGGVGWLVVTDSDGTTTQSPAHKAFSGPVAVD